MARLIDVHNGFVGVTAEQLREAHQAGHPDRGDLRAAGRSRLTLAWF